MDGGLIIDKPEGWTSHDVVAKIRHIVKIKKVGHLGTLDPIATGVLPLVTGRATRLAQFYTRSDKIYEAVVRLGFSTNTYDRAGAPTSPVVEPVIDRDELEHQLARFRGSILQSPPPVSAKKVGGTRAYKLARAQVAVELPPVPVEIFELTLLRIHGSEVALRAHCSGGTYMRSIAHDLGQALGCGAHLSELRRAASGEFRIEQAHTPAELEVLVSESRLAEVLIPAAQLLPHFPSVYAEPQIIAYIRQGRNFPVSPFRAQPGSRYIKAISREGELIAIGEAKLPNLYHPVVVM